jgi:RNA polymerase sigma factor (sigma-70 family)
MSKRRTDSTQSSRRTVSEFERELVALTPFVGSWSRALCARRGIADDMVQETLERAWRGRARFEPGTNMKAWLFTILRNQINSQQRRAWRQMPWDEALGNQIEAPPLEQEWVMQLSDTARAVATLPHRRRDALILVGAGGYTYREAAEISGLAEGTVKSRVARARASVSDMLEGNRSMPPRPKQRATTSESEVVAQLSALTRSQAHRKAAHV